MQFLHPWFLAALSTLAIPVIIHLFYFRRFKKVYFSSVRFLKEVKDETSARSKLKNILVLIARLLAIALLVMAFAQPYVSKKAKEKFAKNQIGIFVDNSYSMNAVSDEIPLLSLAKQRARTIVESYNVEDQFMILTHTFEGKQFRLVSQEEAIAMIDEIKPTPAAHLLTEVLSKIKYTIAKNEGNKHIYFISDFQKSISDLPPQNDTSATINLIPLQSIQERNVAIDTAWFESPVQWVNRPNLLKYKIHNYGDQAIHDARVSITQNNQSKPLGLISLAAGESKTDTAQIIVARAGWQSIKLEITDHPIQFDDYLNIAFKIDEKINVLVISSFEPNANLLTAIKSIPSVELSLQTTSNINYGKIAQNKLIILDDLISLSSGLSNELTNALKQGSNVLIFPGSGADVNSFSNFTSPLGAGSFLGFEKRPLSASRINTNEFTFNDVFLRVTSNMKLPTIQGKFTRRKGTRGEETIISFPDESALISKVNVENGALFISSSPLSSDWSDLSKNAEIFVPMIYRMALNKNKVNKIALFIGQDETMELELVKKSPDDVIHLLGHENEDIIPLQQTRGNKISLDLRGIIKNATIYQVAIQDSIIAELPFNFNRKESDLRTYTEEQLISTYPNFKIIQARNSTAFESWFKENNKGTAYWKWFILGTLLFLLVESLLLRFWKI